MCLTPCVCQALCRGCTGRYSPWLGGVYPPSTNKGWINFPEETSTCRRAPYRLGASSPAAPFSAFHTPASPALRMSSLRVCRTEGEDGIHHCRAEVTRVKTCLWTSRWSSGLEPACPANAGSTGWIPGLRRCLEPWGDQALVPRLLNLLRPEKPAPPEPTASDTPAVSAHATAREQPLLAAPRERPCTATETQRHQNTQVSKYVFKKTCLHPRQI